MQLNSPQIAVWTNPSGTGDGIAPGSTELVVVGGMHSKGVGESGLSVGSVDWMVSDLLKGSQTVLGFIAWRAVILEASKALWMTTAHPCQDVLMTTPDFVSEVS